MNMEHNKLRLREELEKMWRVKVTAVPVESAAFSEVTPKIGTTSETSVQKS